jgi:hypothetical protein
MGSGEDDTPLVQQPQPKKLPEESAEKPKDTTAPQPPPPQQAPASDGNTELTWKKLVMLEEAAIARGQCSENQFWATVTNKDKEPKSTREGARKRVELYHEKKWSMKFIYAWLEHAIRSFCPKGTIELNKKLKAMSADMDKLALDLGYKNLIQMDEGAYKVLDRAIYLVETNKDNWDLAMATAKDMLFNQEEVTDESMF